MKRAVQISLAAGVISFFASVLAHKIWLDAHYEAGSFMRALHAWAYGGFHQIIAFAVSGVVFVLVLIIQLWRDANAAA